MSQQNSKSEEEDDDDTLLEGRRRSEENDQDQSKCDSSSPLLLFRTRFSDLSASLQRRTSRSDDDDDDDDHEDDDEPKRCATMAKLRRHNSKILVEVAKLNLELSAVVTNLRARREESDHINQLLIERAERAAQRIIFLQSRIATLEQELSENDDDLQHLHIRIKALEIQLKPHPDEDLQRCLSVIRHDYQALRRKRASRPVVDYSPPF
ncbi:hypothetical protein L249_0425 [Ophiocordyceps polyrhachis-furcata BCC 54312]|uniref:Uncharacterized protein n=1 Tax=Ophiocordyceps polyrhachis-furcata BCC 54312 TaxID=1330021 RepID=A0A367LFE6_9HYPO|nr:hypothetical protein L249_0425 [Ophiocordyceps polyrhachis-furcata BCC 54312]